jgi:CHAT domain-containing protein
MRKSHSWAWITGSTVLATVAVGLFLFHSVDPKHRLRAAASQLDRRPFETRLSGFPYSPLRVNRGTNDPAPPALLRLHGIAGEILSQSTISTSAEALHIRAIAALLSGDSATAVDLLEHATTLMPSDAILRNDLAAALVARGMSAYDYAEALASTDRAIAIETSPEALFNRGVILQKLGLRQAASRAWHSYLAIDSTSSWAGEARERLAGQTTPNERDLWTRDIPRLRRAAISGDIETVRQLVRRYPQQARSWSEMQFLADWAKALSTGNLAAATGELTICRTIGSALQALSGERLLADAVASIDRAQGENIKKIAQGHVDYLEARRLYHERKPAESLPKFEEAASLFSSQHSPMALVCNYYRSSIIFDRNDNRAAAALVDRLTEEIPAEYLALRAQVIWNRATISANDGAFDAARSAYAAALAMFEHLGESDNALMMRGALVSVLSRLGRGSEAWNERRDAFEQVSTSGNATAQLFVLGAAMDDEIAQQHWPVASAIARIIIEEEPANPRLRFLALRCRAYADLRMKNDGFAADLGAARHAATMIADPGLRESALDELGFVEAIDASEQNPRLALTLLDANTAFAKTHQGFTIPTIHLARARALKRLGSTEQAIDSLRASIATIEQRRTTVGSDDLRDAFLGTSEEAYRDLIDILTARGDANAALEIAESFRGRTILELTGRSDAERQPLSSSELMAHLPPDALAVEYVALPNRLIIFIIDHYAIELRQINVSRKQLSELAHTFAKSIVANQIHNGRGSILYDLLISPLQPKLGRVTQMAIIPDDELRNVPFAALWDPSRSLYLIEEAAIEVAPSASAFVQACQTSPTRTSRRLLAVGDVPIDRHMFPELGKLINVPAEIQTVAQSYPTPVILSGSAATKRAFLLNLPDSDFVHVATHAVTRASGIAGLVLAADGSDDGTLDTREIAMLRLPRRPVVVLAGCRTAFAGSVGNDLARLSDAFLAAGATSVIASLWPVDDAATLNFSVRLHEEIRRGRTPAIALRNVQLQMLHAVDGPTRAPDRWSGFELYGSGL